MMHSAVGGGWDCCVVVCSGRLGTRSYASLDSLLLSIECGGATGTQSRRELEAQNRAYNWATRIIDLIGEW
jgi:hypothetical protein